MRKSERIKKLLSGYQWSVKGRIGEKYVRVTFNEKSVFWYGKRKKGGEGLKEVCDALFLERVMDWSTNVFSKEELAEKCQREMEKNYLSPRSIWEKVEGKKRSLFLQKVFLMLNWGEEKKVYSDFLTVFFLSFSIFSPRDLRLVWKEKGGRTEDLVIYCYRLEKEKMFFLSLTEQEGKVKGMSSDWRKEAKRWRKKYLPCLPMVAKPKDWKWSENLVSNSSGGYYMNETFSFYFLQKESPKLSLQVSEDWLEGFNKMQSQRFRVNWDFLRVIAFDELYKKEEKVLFSYYGNLSYYMLPHDPIYFPLMVDGRGRIYAKGALNPTFQKLVRASLENWEHRKIKEEEWKSQLGLVFGDETVWSQRLKNYSKKTVLQMDQRKKDPSFGWDSDYEKLKLSIYGWLRASQCLVQLDAPSSCVQLVSCLLRMEKSWLKKVNVGTSKEEAIGSWYVGKQKKEVWKQDVFYSLFGLKENKLKEYKLFHNWNNFFKRVETHLPAEWSWKTPAGSKIRVKAVSGADLAAHLVHSLESALVILFAKETKISTFFWIHDGVLVPAGEMEEVRKQMGVVFQKVFDEVDLHEIWTQWSKELPIRDPFLEDWLKKEVPKRKLSLQDSYYLLK